MWLISAIFTIIGVLLVGGLGGWETYALKKDKTTITDFIRQHPHFSILAGLLVSVLFGIFGYTLGVGGK